MGRPPAPYRIETERLVLRCYEPRDAALVKDAIDSSLDHLRPWMPWAEQRAADARGEDELLKTFRSQFDLGDNFVMGIFSRGRVRGARRHRAPSAQRAGRARDRLLHPRERDAAGIRHRVDGGADARRLRDLRGGPDRDPHRSRNEASLGVPRKLGFIEEATLRRRLPGGAAGRCAT